MTLEIGVGSGSSRPSRPFASYGRASHSQPFHNHPCTEGKQTKKTAKRSSRVLKSLCCKACADEYPPACAERTAGSAMKGAGAGREFSSWGGVSGESRRRGGKRGRTASIGHSMRTGGPRRKFSLLPLRLSNTALIIFRGAAGRDSAPNSKTQGKTARGHRPPRRARVKLCRLTGCPRLPRPKSGDCAAG
jgi:hypothetical protein